MAIIACNRKGVDHVETCLLGRRMLKDHNGEKVDHFRICLLAVQKMISPKKNLKRRFQRKPVLLKGVLSPPTVFVVVAGLLFLERTQFGDRDEEVIDEQVLQDLVLSA